MTDETNLVKREVRKLIEERSDDALLLLRANGGGDTKSSGDVMPDEIIYRQDNKEVSIHKRKTKAKELWK